MRRFRTGVAAALIAASITLACDAAQTSRTHQLLLGTGFSAPFNLEEPFINLAQTRAAAWVFGTKKARTVEGSEALAGGLIDPETYMPTGKTQGSVSAGQFFPGAEKYRDWYADDYVLEWEGEARGFVQGWERAEIERSDNRVVYRLGPRQATSGVLRFAAIGDGFGKVRFYRRKYGPLLAAGKIWNPDFIDYVKRYDIVRTMDIQSTNNIQVRRFDQLATMDEPWGQRAGFGWPEAPFFSAPYEILFNLGVEADVAIWLTIPPEIGAPLSPADPSVRRQDNRARIDVEKFRATTAAHAKATLESPEWANFARQFADRYLASGYPAGRPLYVEIGNEIWNFNFAVSTNYAAGIAQGIDPTWKIGHGYGVLTARFAMALEQEFAARKVRPNVVYVIASHVANPWRTKQALDGFSAYLKSAGADPDAYLAKTGVAVTNYYGQFDPLSQALFGEGRPKAYVPLWLAAIDEDPEGLAARVSGLLKGGASVKSSAPWLVARWKEHEAMARRGGSRFIGAYEGGSHLKPPKELARSAAFRRWWMDYHWGEDGADVARTVNETLIAAFPNAIIANYESIGDIRPESPWIDGHYAAPTPMMRMWDEFARPERVR